MFGPGDLSKLFNQFFSKEEQEQIMDLQYADFDDRMDGLADIFEKNAKIPGGQGKVMAQAMRDPEIREDMKGLEDAAANGAGQMELMQKGMQLAMKMKNKFGG